MAVQSETELYLPVKSFLERLGYEVKSEVHGCDIVAFRGESREPVIVELKKTFNLPLLFQGIDRLKLSDQVYLAVEQTRAKKGAQNQRWNDIRKLCRMLGLGLITVTFYKTKRPVVEVQCDPEPYVPRKLNRLTARLAHEFNERSGDYNVGGSTRRKLVTAYRERALECAHLIKTHGPLSPRKLREMTGNTHVGGILQKNVYRWFIRLQRGIYGLTPLGEQALQTYADVIEAMFSES